MMSVMLVRCDDGRVTWCLWLYKGIVMPVIMEGHCDAGRVPCSV